MTNKIIEYSGHTFSLEDIELIKATVALYPNLSRKELANTICELLEWLQINGTPKVIPCISFLNRLSDEGVIKLPPSRNTKNTGARKSEAKEDRDLSWVNTEEIKESESIQLEVIRSGGERMRQWRMYMSEYHTLGDPTVFGAQMRYAIKSGNDRDLGCMLFSASSWALAPRDKWIGWTLAERKKQLQLVVNQSRFLILPWVRIKNLASRVLSMAAKRIQDDWLRDYHYAPVLLETFVDITKYKGTCYKASNWIYLGETQGRGRNDRYKEQALTRKAIYVYPLQKDFKSILVGSKPCKVVAYDG